MVCKECGKIFSGKIYPNGLCQGCYNYFRKGGIVHELPSPGCIQKDEKGYVICHICGRAYKRLGSHIRESHSLTIKEYKERFGLCNNSKTTEPSYSQHMRFLAYEHGCPIRLAQYGKSTRIKPGETRMRLGKKGRLQENIDKSNRMRGRMDSYDKSVCIKN